MTYKQVLTIFTILLSLLFPLFCLSQATVAESIAGKIFQTRELVIDL